MLYLLSSYWPCSYDNICKLCINNRQFNRFHMPILAIHHHRWFCWMINFSWWQLLSGWSLTKHVSLAESVEQSCFINYRTSINGPTLKWVDELSIVNFISFIVFMGGREINTKMTLLQSRSCWVSVQRYV